MSKICSDVEIMKTFEMFNNFKGAFLESVLIKYVDDDKIDCRVSVKAYNKNEESKSERNVDIFVLNVSSYSLKKQPFSKRMPIYAGIHLFAGDGKIGIDVGKLSHQPKTLEEFVASKMFFLGDVIEIKIND